MTKHSMFFIAVDLGNKHSHLAILDQERELIAEARLPSTPGAFQRMFRPPDTSAQLSHQIGASDGETDRLCQQA